MGQSRISTQLSQLKTEGLVVDERSGKNNIYRCVSGEDIMEVAKLAAEEVPELKSDRTALRHLLRKRRDKTRAYFDELAGRFGKDYVPGRSWKGLAEALIKTLNYDVVADLGAGEGLPSPNFSLSVPAMSLLSISHRRWSSTVRHWRRRMAWTTSSIARATLSLRRLRLEPSTCASSVRPYIMPNIHKKPSIQPSRHSSRAVG